MVVPLLALVSSLSVSPQSPVIQQKAAVFHSNRPKAAAPPSSLAAAARRIPETARHFLPALSEAERASLVSRDSREGARSKIPAEKVGIVRMLPASAGFDRA